MLTPKQNLLETLKKDGKPECLCNSFTMFRGIPGDPCFKLIIRVGSTDTVSSDQLKAGISRNPSEHGKGITQTFRFSVFF